MRERWTRDEDRELVGQHAVHRLPYWQIAENLGRTGPACAMRMRTFSVLYYTDLVKEYVAEMGE